MGCLWGVFVLEVVVVVGVGVAGASVVVAAPRFSSGRLLEGVEIATPKARGSEGIPTPHGRCCWRHGYEANCEKQECKEQQNGGAVFSRGPCRAIEAINSDRYSRTIIKGEMGKTSETR